MSDLEKLIEILKKIEADKEKRRIYMREYGKKYYHTHKEKWLPKDPETGERVKRTYARGKYKKVEEV